MTVTVGVMGSSHKTLSHDRAEELETMCAQLGQEIAARKLVLITGETTGASRIVARSVRDAGGLTIGISAAHNEKEHIERYAKPKPSSDVVIYTGFGLKGRNVINVRSSDIVLIVSGSIGTLNEFTIAYDEGKVIGVLSGSGGVADEIPSILKTCNKESGAKVLYSSDPKDLLSQCLREHEKRL